MAIETEAVDELIHGQLALGVRAAVEAERHLYGTDVLQEELLGDPIEDARILVEVLAQIQPLARTNLMNKRKVLDLMQEKVLETAENAVARHTASYK